MKKFIPIIIIILILIIVILSNNNQSVTTLFAEQKEIVENKNKDLSNISEEKIKNSITEIKNNYLNIKDKTILEDVVYNVTYLEYLTSKVKESQLNDLVTYTKDYLNTKSQESKDNLANYFKQIESKEDELIRELYVNYNTMITLEDILFLNTNIVTNDLNDSNMISEENINKAIDYIATYYQEPYKNDEIIDKISYYSLYLSGISHQRNNITNLGISTLNYLQSLSNEDKKTIEEYLSKVKENQSVQVKSLYRQISN
ncbi:MAG TPA: hypothetical protein IAC02_05165 [Candidatus Coprovivens excrementavium]|nr:hypothetical protein [Candidatus Coprovivens excrementavium]